MGNTSYQGVLAVALIIVGIFCFYVFQASNTFGLPYELTWDISVKLVCLVLAVFFLRFIGVEGTIFPFWTIALLLVFFTITPALDYLGSSLVPTPLGRHEEQVMYEWYANTKVQLLIGAAIFICGYKLEN